MNRKSSAAVKISDAIIGAGNPVVVQSMTNTDTGDVIRTAVQIAELARAGSELVRITVNDEAAAAAVPKIKEQLAKMDCAVPIVGDFHFNGHRLLEKFPACAELLDKYRINPGNVGRGKKRDEQFSYMIETPCKYGKAVRIGANWGSLDQELLARLLDENAQRDTPRELQEINREAVINSALGKRGACRTNRPWPREKIIISCKMSGVQDLIAVYRELANRCSYALHLRADRSRNGLPKALSPLLPRWPCCYRKVSVTLFAYH